MRKLFGLVLVLSILLGCAYFYALYFFIPEKIKSGFSQALAQAGFEHVAYENVSASAGVVVFRGIKLDEKGFAKIEHVDVRYSPFTYLFSGEAADFIKISKLRLTGELSENYDLTLAGWQVENGLLKKLATVSTRTLIFEDSAVDLFSPQLGGLKLDFAGQVKKGSGQKGELSFFGRIKSQQKKLSFDASVTGTLSENGLLDMTSTADELQIDNEDLKLNRASAEITFTKLPDTSPSIAIRGPAASLKWKTLPFGDMNYVIEYKDGEFNLFAEGKTQGPEKIDFSVGVKSGSEGTNYDVVMHPQNLPLLLTFLNRNGLIKDGQPILPLLANLKSPTISLSFDETIGTSADVVGTWSLEAEAQGLSIDGEFSGDPKQPDSWSAQCKKASFTEEAEEGSLAPPFYTDIPLDCHLTWDGKTSPPFTTWAIKANIKNEELRFGPVRLIKIRGQVGEKYAGKGTPERRSVLAYELALKKGISHTGRIVLNLDGTGHGLIQSLILYIYGGQIRADNFDLKGLSFPSQMTFKISDIDLTEYLSDLNLPKMAVFGRMGGVIPLIKRKGKLTIKDGLLQSQEPGIIKMPQQISYSLFPGSDSQMATIREALENYHYEFFELRLDGTVAGGVMITLNSRGTNPDMIDKRPIEMNFQIETEIGVLVEHMLEKSPSR